ncbi:MAG: trypsin-like peptidase domain-containing protein [gamma proteobacterium symbiont of Bathyaustriella thionipta]|nr:trypsin-like peptidase domain-containing protein [gamma proteobacterium symbiont of Bathyaustriella thionipta]
MTHKQAAFPVQLWLAIALFTPVLTLQAASLADRFERVNPAVVVIHTAETSIASSKHNTTSVPGLGSGVFISADQILTAAHVVHTADLVEVETLHGERALAEVISSEPRADLALLQLYEPLKNVVTAKLANSDKVRIGDEVFVIGNPYGLGHSLSWGHISGRHTPNEHMGDFSRAEFFQTDAAINQGNSGGPVFNQNGEVIGIVSHIQSQTGGNVGLGFAVTSNTARDLLLSQRSFYSGFDSVALKGVLAQAFHLPQSAGLLVQRVAKGSFAQRLGLIGGTIPARIGGENILLGGDVILQIEGIRISGKDSMDAIRQRINALEIGDLLHMSILRNGQVETLSSYVLI